jgi:hypothetical protein
VFPAPTAPSVEFNVFSTVEVILVYELIPELLLAAQLYATECVALLTPVPVSAAECW